MRVRLAAVPDWALVALLVLASAALRFWAATGVATPWITPDEETYALLGRSLYSSGSFEILGQTTHFYSLISPALAGLPLRLHDLGAGYTLLKGIQALVMSLAAVPVYAWARSLASRGNGARAWPALLAAALTLAIPGLAYSGLVMTEVAFYPLAVLAAWTMARALTRPTLANQALAVAASVLAAATRLQAVVLVPVFVTAVLLVAVFERRPRAVLRYRPALLGFALASVGWVAWRLSSNEPASGLLGAYRAAGEVSYSASDAVLYTRWHLADLVLFTGVVPFCAALVLLVGAFLGRERAAEVRAYLAVAAALCAGFVVEVAIFASRHVGHLAERDLLALAPVCFVGLAVWLDRGAPRPFVATAGAAALALVLVLSLPLGKLVALAAIPDSFTIIPLYRLRVRWPGLDVQLLVDLLVAAAVVAFALLPRRFRLALPVALVLAFISVSASRVVAAQAKLSGQPVATDSNRWIDDATAGPVTYLYSDDIPFVSVWQSLFWNRSVDRVYSLLEARVTGLTDIQGPSVGPKPDGRIVLADGSPARGGYVVASSALSFFGSQVAYRFAPSLVLWKVEQPLRLAQWVQVAKAGELVQRVEVREYACRGGTLRLRLLSQVPQRVVVARNDTRLRVVSLPAGKPWQGTIVGVPLRGQCNFELEPEQSFDLQRVEFERRLAP